MIMHGAHLVMQAASLHQQLSMEQQCACCFVALGPPADVAAT